jgi:hypothetical protein
MLTYTKPVVCTCNLHKTCFIRMEDEAHCSEKNVPGASLGDNELLPLLVQGRLC